MIDLQSFYRGKNVLVTGAGGFIGSHLAEVLVRNGANVTAMIKYGSSSHWGNLEHADANTKRSLQVVAGNVEDSDFVMNVVKGKDVVFHLAALIAIPYSYVAPRSYVRTNVEGTLNVVEAARRLGTSRVVHTSTSEVYGTALREPIDEDHPLQGQSPYSASKIGADKIAESYYRSFSTPVVTLRPFNTFGPRQSARAFIPTIISQAVTRDVIELGALDPMRDMTFVGDTVAGFLLAGATSGIDGQTINLGTGSTASIGDFATKILKLMNCSKPVTQDPKRLRPAESEVLKLVSDNSKAQRLLGWTPATSVEDGLKQTISFVEANIHLYRPTEYTV
ncbi:putative dTDP-glucose 4,6-dehydratase [Rhizobium freirei PRF 81]|uniref:Putative dTDP-glucose 4,6-dehydratase n=1 Tax=Rhizobium freirei PRF 81 TaxID=363754 RepID=N6U1I0_9HYPH|nr:SDR family NAD(P)-dependent oxidoreductase [Rhizobium freirei]ENN84218.1 putative dTDP-glucose 4,6-dehydratase [Rhizobium freirei PRF 81]